MPSDPSLRSLPGYANAGMARVDRAQWLAVTRTRRAAGASLLALWGSDERDGRGDFSVWAALLERGELVVLELPVPEAAPSFPSLTPIFPVAGRMERALQDLLGVRAEDGDPRPWLRHASWPADSFPLRRDYMGAASAAVPEPSYGFVRVEGDGVHEIPVGPVHAGIIEPGHFRFSVVGEKVLRLEERLGYTHKGIEKRFEELSANDGRRLAARVSGDSAVAFSWSYCMALEGLCGVTPPARALWLRGLALERERIANHLGDLGALGNDAGFGFGLAQFTRLKEQLLRANALAFGERYLMDAVVPGGVARDLADDARDALIEQGTQLAAEVAILRAIYGDHSGVQDRFVGCGVVPPALALELGVIGMPARASGQAADLRCDTPHPPYDRLAVKAARRTEGDVAARVEVRFDEVIESLRVCRLLLEQLPEGDIGAALPPPRIDVPGIGLVEGWRGPVFVALQANRDGGVRRCHPHDPSWQNWPALEHAVIGNIVPDFPLINKSFNLSYSGHDL